VEYPHADEILVVVTSPHSPQRAFRGVWDVVNAKPCRHTTFCRSTLAPAICETSATPPIRKHRAQARWNPSPRKHRAQAWWPAPPSRPAESLRPGSTGREPGGLPTAGLSFLQPAPRKRERPDRISRPGRPAVLNRRQAHGVAGVELELDPIAIPEPIPAPSSAAVVRMG
jgi:hypothetical protein